MFITYVHSRPILHIMDDEREYDDEEDLEDSPEEEGELLSENMLTRKKLLELQQFWPGHFESQNIEAIHGLARNTNASIIRLKLGDWKDISYTWLKDMEKDSVNKDKYWLKTNLDKISKSPYVPSLDKNIKFPKRLPVSFPSKTEENYFLSQQFAKSGSKLTVPSLIFGADSMKIPNSEDPMCEYWSRQCTLDCQITNELLLVETDITNSISELLDKLQISDSDTDTINDIKHSVSLLLDTNKMARASNFRAKSLAITASCKAKLNMRDTLLSKVKGDNFIKDALRGSCFMNEDIFGPIPVNIQSKIDAFSNRSDAKLTPKYNKRTGESFSRRGNNKRRGTINSFNYNLPSNYPSNYSANNYQGFNYGYDNPSTSNSGYNGSQGSQSALFHEKPRHRGSRGKPRKARGRGRGSRS